MQQLLKRTIINIKNNKLTKKNANMFLIFLNTKLHFFFDKSDKKTKKKLKRKEASLAGSLLERWLELRYNEVDFSGIFLFAGFPFFCGITVLRYFPLRDYGIT